MAYRKGRRISGGGGGSSGGGHEMAAAVRIGKGNDEDARDRGARG